MKFQRYPTTSNHSLQAWNAADEYLVQEAVTRLQPDNKIGICNDRFGYLSCFFHENKPDVVVHLHSQQKAIQQNRSLNSIAFPGTFLTPFTRDVLSPWSVCIIHVPKSLELFEWFLHLTHLFSRDDVTVYCGFLTRHFTKTWLDIASRYFENVSQTKAFKKSRLLVLEKKKIQTIPYDNIHEVGFKDVSYSQYKGVFSREKIDLATQFLLENVKLEPIEKTILDWGCGNGIIGIELIKKYDALEVTFMDDNILALESARLNYPGGNFVWNDDISVFPDGSFDLIVSNPPFHFEYETDITITCQFIEEVKTKLRQGGRMVLVSNRHINYKTHLKKHFEEVKTIKENERFVIYSSSKPLS